VHATIEGEMFSYTALDQRREAKTTQNSVFAGRLKSPMWTFSSTQSRNVWPLFNRDKNRPADFVVYSLA